jgi:hypothetical protein
MTRYVDPVTQFFDDAGDVLAGGKLYFYRTGTTTDLTTYADQFESIPNTQPLVLTADGRLPNCYFTGTAKVRLTDANDNLIWERDPIGQDNIAGELENYVGTITYTKGQLVLGSDGEYYQSLQDNNQGKDPTTPSPAFWTQVRFIKTWNSSETYASGDIVQNPEGELFKSMINANTANNPTSDNGTNWQPAIRVGSLIGVNASVLDMTDDYVWTGGQDFTGATVSGLGSASFLLSDNYAWSGDHTWVKTVDGGGYAMVQRNPSSIAASSVSFDQQVRNVADTANRNFSLVSTNDGISVITNTDTDAAARIDVNVAGANRARFGNGATTLFDPVVMNASLDVTGQADLNNVTRGSGATTLNRNGNMTYHEDSGTTDYTITLGTSYIASNDVVIISKLRDSGTLTIASGDGNIALPDGTSAASHTINTNMSIILYRTAGAWTVNIL